MKLKTHILQTAAACALTGLTVGAAHAQTTDWSGFYIGGAVGYAMGDNGGETVLFDTNRDGAFNDTVRTGAGADAFSPGFCEGAAVGRAPADGCRGNSDNLNLALRAGYDWQMGPWVIGGLAEISQARLGSDVSAFSTTPASYTFTRDIDTVLAVRARGGYAWDRMLAYATGGYARAEVENGFSSTNTANSFTQSGGGDVDGYQVGGGVEYAWNDNWSVGLEYLYTSLSGDDHRVAVGRGTAPPTNPFLLVNPAGTDMRRSDDSFAFSTVNLTLNLRY